MPERSEKRTSEGPVLLSGGNSLDPLPPVDSKQGGIRYLHVHEGEPLDQEQFADWVKQASALPGEPLF